MSDGMLADSHAHLSMAQFAGDLPEVIARARQAGVTRIMTCATSMADAGRNLDIAKTHGLAASVGFHPHQAKEWDDASEAALRELIGKHQEIRAIGEIGLDFHYSFSPHDTQREVLRRQIALARSVQRPVIVHCRTAAADVAEILRTERAGDCGGVLHCFSEDVAFARLCLDMGFYISFSGIVTFKKTLPLHDVVKMVPEDRLLVETDAPYLTPAPHRGKRNEPAHVAETARYVAGLRGETAEKVGESTGRNFERLFGGKNTP